VLKAWEFELVRVFLLFPVFKVLAPEVKKLAAPPAEAYRLELLYGC
jgi:hypothetical protein